MMRASPGDQEIKQKFLRGYAQSAMRHAQSAFPLAARGKKSNFMTGEFFLQLIGMIECWVWKIGKIRY
jgi:hypothetical protein